MKSLKIPENTKYYLIFFIFSFMSVFFIELCYYRFNFHNTFSWMINNIYLLGMSVVIIMSLMVFIFVLFRHVSLAIYIPTLISVVYGVGLYLKLLYRKVPALPYEISMLLDLGEMLAFLSLPQQIGVYVIALISIVALIVLFKREKRVELTKDFRLTNILICMYIVVLLINYNTKNEILFIIFNLLFTLYILYEIHTTSVQLKLKLISCVLLFAFIAPSYNANVVKTMVSYKAVYPNGDFAFENFDLDGVVPAFLSYANLKYVDKPENYSEEEIIRIVEKYKQIEAVENKNKIDINSINPNIVYIMSESFSDLKNVDNINVNKNPLKNLYELSEEYPSGTTIAQGFGGGTNMSEFEALTGVSSIFLNNAMFFNNISKRTEFPSIVSLLENQGYQSAAIHFNSALFYERSTGYENLGIDHFYSDKELEMEYFDNNQSYSNDESSFKQIYKVLKDYDKPTFIHNVTIQNHGPYPFEISNNDYVVEGLYDADKSVEAQTYYKEIEHSDEVLNEFLKEIDNFNEPTIVVYWGDHLPYFYEDQDFGSDIMDKYRTPILVYSNFSTEGEDLGEFSMNYISTSLFDNFNFKEPAYYYLLNDLKNESAILHGAYNRTKPVSTFSLYEKGLEIDAESEQVFKDYEMILYDIFVGENYSVDKGFFTIDE